MALADFFWACPSCGGGSLRNDEARCNECGTRFERGGGSDIVAIAPDGSRLSRSPAEWLDRLPQPEEIIDRHSGAEPIRSARVEIRRVEAERRVTGENGYLNRVELFGEPVAGVLELHPDHLRVVEDPAGQEAQVWPLDSLTAVQASSGALQLKRRDRPLVAFRFQDDAIYFWELLVRAALRDFYGRTGRGVIVEFQPRIVTR